jgi:uncharacterized MAPEG superfamily protein
MGAMSLSEWALLGFTVWTIALVVGGIGVTRIAQVLTKRAKANSFSPNVPHGSERYQRTMRAHLNCVENLPVFAALVLLGSAHSMTGSHFQAAAFAVLPARILQSSIHIASGRNRAVLARFVFFSVQVTCFLVMAFLLATSRLD